VCEPYDKAGRLHVAFGVVQYLIYHSTLRVALWVVDEKNGRVNALERDALREVWVWYIFGETEVEVSLDR